MITLKFIKLSPNTYWINDLNGYKEFFIYPRYLSKYKQTEVKLSEKTEPSITFNVNEKRYTELFDKVYFDPHLRIVYFCKGFRIVKKLSAYNVNTSKKWDSYLNETNLTIIVNKIKKRKNLTYTIKCGTKESSTILFNILESMFS